MKTTNRLPRLFPFIACPLFALAAVSCQTTSNVPKTTHVPVSMAGAKWVKVSSQPPTYYPKGVAADCPTDHWSGEWVYTGDERGTRYFIPLHGLGGSRRSALVEDALSARSPQKLEQIASEERGMRGRAIAYSPVLVPMNFMLALGGASSGVDESALEDLVGEIKKTWREADSTVAPRGYETARK